MERNQSELELTISVICSGRDGVTERCLKSFENLRKCVASELVVIDTGCSQELLNTVEKYADRIEKFEWCNDFSAVRNYQIEQARGKWLLYLDDDEWMEATDSLVSFFSSKAYEMYKLAQITIRNYANDNKSNWIDSRLMRLINIEKKPYFRGRVHEYIDLSTDNYYVIDDVIGHSGYIFCSQEEMEERTRRNLALIQKELEDNPDSNMYKLYLLQEYRALKMYNEIESYAKTSLKKMEGDISEWSVRTRSSYVAALAMAYSKLEKYENLICLWRNKNTSEISGLSYIFVLEEVVAESFKNCDYNVCLEAGREFLDKYKNYKSHPEKIEQENGILLDTVFEVSRINSTFVKLFDCALLQKKEDIVDNNLDLTGWKENNQTLFVRYSKDYEPVNSREKTKKLTISVLCSGRADTTEKCLSSMMNIRKNIPSEIIVVDTGCDEQTRQVVEKYADKVVDFEWCNDFSKARNTQLAAANGEWFMFLDDDEYFEDDSDLIHFFKSGDYKKYSMGEILCRSYLDEAFKKYTDMWVPRMAKVTKALRFDGIIHECYHNISGKRLIFNSRIGHTGYMYLTNEQKIEHSKRNIPLIKKMLEENPDSTMYQMYLLNEYSTLDDYPAMIQKADEYLKMLGNVREDFHAMVARGTFYTAKVMAYSILEEAEKVEEIYREIKESTKIFDLAKAYIASSASVKYYLEDDYENCIEASKRYIDIYDKLKNNPTELKRQMGLMLDYTFEGEWKNQIICYLLTSAMQLNRYDILESYGSSLDWEIEDIRLNQGFVELLIIKAALEKREIINQLLAHFFENDEMLAMFEYAFISVLKKLGEDNIDLLISNIEPKYEKAICFIRENDLVRKKEFVEIIKKEDSNRFSELYNLEEKLMYQINELIERGKNDDAIRTKTQMEQMIESIYGIRSLHV